MPTVDDLETPSCRSCPVWKESLFADLPDRALADLDRRKEPLRFAKGEHIFDEGAPATCIYCIRSGVAKVVQGDAQGKAAMVRIAPPGDTVGHRSIFTRATFRGSARATDALSACRVQKDTLLHLLGDNPGFAQRIIMRMAQDIEAGDQRHRALREKNVRERLALLLVELADACGVEQPDRSWRLAVQLTKSDLAAMLGTAYETAIRFTTELKQEGLLRQEGRTIFITDLAKLRAVAGLPPRS